MASFADYWARLTLSQSQLDDDDVRMTLTVGALKKALERAYNAGAADTHKVEQAVDKLKRSIGGGFFRD